MKDGLHPKFYSDARATCATCSKVFIVGSTKPEMNLDVCSGCHPFYTGQQRMESRGGRVDRFRKRYNLSK